MSKTKYMTKFQLEHLKDRVSNEIDPLIEEAQLLQKSIIAELTESAELKLAKKIKADVVIKELENAFQNLEIVQRKAQTFFSKNATSSTLKDNLNYRFKDKQEAIIKTGSYRGNGISPADCREQLREWASTLAHARSLGRRRLPKGEDCRILGLWGQQMPGHGGSARPLMWWARAASSPILGPKPTPRRISLPMMACRA
jgi:hypothetical protein